MWRRDALGLLAALALGASACGDGAPALGPGLNELPRDTVFLDVPYCTGGGDPLPMDLYFPPDDVGPDAPAALYVHGGAWSSGDKRGEPFLDMLYPLLLARGYVVASIAYRLAPAHPWPAMIEDATCAMRHLRANASTYGLDPSRIGALGSSAGAHLASLLGVAGDEPSFQGRGGFAGRSARAQAVVNMFGPTDLTSDDWSPAVILGFSLVFGTSDRSSEVLATASPVTHVSSDDAPHLTLHGEDDALVPVTQAFALHERLTRAAVPSELVVVANADHGFAATDGPIEPSIDALVGRALAFFESRLGTGR